MRILFMGSAPLSCPPLQMLVEQSLSGTGIELAGVVTQPDRARGRSLRVEPCPARRVAEEAQLKVLTPENVNSSESLEAIRLLEPNLIVVVAYGQILKKELLTLPPLGCVNIHASLLPKYRGAAPIQWAIARGETVTGVTAMFINERMDAGDILRRKEVSIQEDETAGLLHERLAVEGAELLREVLHDFKKNCVHREAQQEELVTFAPKLSKKDGHIDWTGSTREIHNRVRGFNPWPCCFTMLEDGHVLRVLRVRVDECDTNDAGTDDMAPGTVLSVSGGGPLVCAGDTMERSGSIRGIRLIEVQPEGGKVMSGDDYLRGHNMNAGSRLN